ncbi:hypothetical protein KY308_03090 [Candidatus Woesearchaeota archaeon]|nr:hypothetical protein [Candidatus Woesearchaeota archaeon]
MDELKKTQDEALSNSYKIKQDLEAIKSDYTPKDKFNLLKIKVGEINDNLKKIWDLERDFKKLDERKTEKADFEKDMGKFREDVSKGFSDQNTNFTSKLAQLNDRTAKTFEKVNENLKVAVTKTQVSALISDMNKEFNFIKAEIVELRKIKDTITAKELDRRTGLMNSRIDLIAKEVVKANQKVAECVTGEQAKKLIEEINNEFNDLKKSLADMEKLKRYVGVVEAESLSKKECARRASEFGSAIEDARKEIKQFKDYAKSYAKADDTVKDLNRVESALTRRILDLEKEIMALKRFERRYEQDSAELKSEIREAKVTPRYEKAEKHEKHEPRYEKYEKPKYEKDEKQRYEKLAQVKSRPVKSEPSERKPYFALSVISIILIVLAFASLGGAILEYFALEPAMTNYLTIGAVALFVVGIVMRAVVIKKRNNVSAKF